MWHLHTMNTVLVFLVPAYLTMVSLTTSDKEDDQAWMRYWVVISIFSMLELPLDSLSVFPFYNTVKLVVILWCLTPGHYSGSEVIFRQVHTRDHAIIIRNMVNMCVCGIMLQVFLFKSKPKVWTKAEQAEH